MSAESDDDSFRRMRESTAPKQQRLMSLFQTVCPDGTCGEKESVAAQKLLLIFNLLWRLAWVGRQTAHDRTHAPLCGSFLLSHVR
jgi:hypothetical protein